MVIFTVFQQQQRCKAAVLRLITVSLVSCQFAESLSR